MAPESPISPHGQRLLDALAGVLNGAMGVRFLALAPPGTLRPQVKALLWLGGFGLLWALIAFFLPGYGPSRPKLVSLLAWGGCYSAAAIFLAQNATARIIDTVRNDIIPYAHARYAEKVADDLDRNFGRVWLLALPIAIAGLSVAAALYTVGIELKLTFGLGRRHSVELMFFGLTYFFYFYAAAAAVIAARFYAFFAAHLHEERAYFYVLGAADTPLVRGLSRLATQVLTFWALIFLAIVSSMLLALAPGDYKLPLTSPFLSTMVPIAGFFSLGFGTIVYLGTEARIRAVLQRFAHEHARKLQEDSNSLFSPATNRFPPDPKEVRQEMEWQDRILAGARYGSRAGASLSIALPLAMPVAGLVLKLFGVGG